MLSLLAAETLWIKKKKKNNAWRDFNSLFLFTDVTLDKDVC